MNHYLHVLRFFASLRMTVFGEKVSSAIPLPTIGGVYTHRPQGDTTTLSHAVAVNL